MKFLNRLFLVVYSGFVLAQIEEQKPVTNFMDLDASGKISLVVKTFDQNIQCENLAVSKGEFQLCTKEILPVYHFYISRDCTAGNWFHDITRLYDYFPSNKITKENRLMDWIETNLTKSEKYSEVFKSERILGSGVEYKHSEGRKHNIKFILSDKKFKIGQTLYGIIEFETEPYYIHEINYGFKFNYIHQKVKGALMFKVPISDFQ